MSTLKSPEMTTEKWSPVSKSLCSSCSQWQCKLASSSLPFEANINVNLWEGHMLRSNSQTCFFALVKPAPILAENQTSEARKAKLFRKEEKRKKNKKMDTSVREQRTSALMEAGVPFSLRSIVSCGRASLLSKSLWAITLSSSTPADKTQWRVQGLRWQ